MDSRSLLVARFASQWPGAKPSPRHKAMGRVHDTATFSQPTLAVLDKLRARCLAYLGALEEEQNGKPWLKAGKRRFLVFGHPGTDPQLAFATTKDDQAWLCALAPYMHQHGRSSMRMSGARPDWKTINELIEGAYWNVALKRMLKMLDD